MNTLRRLWEDYKAYHRGEHRVAPKQVRGRIYARSAPPSEGAQCGATPHATLEILITRADGTTETQQAPTEATRHG